MSDAPKVLEQAPAPAPAAAVQVASQTTDQFDNPTSELKISDSDKQGREFVTEGYIGVNEVLFTWTKSLDEYQASLILGSHLTC